MIITMMIHSLIYRIYNNTPQKHTRKTTTNILITTMAVLKRLW